jgi:eukaryotic-like serine/threonine-protein kinase
LSLAGKQEIKIKMARVFTITEGLENLGALKTGGQGSVYKGRRVGEIFTAIKILPTPIMSETADDKNFVSFSNEVQKLKKVNEAPNPNVVKILNSGISDSGNFPFIEMEYIEGPDLGELLQPPHDPVFTIKETLKVAEHLSNALAHCHRAGVRHGDIKSNNVKFNVHTGNYILLDFGLSVMSDEQRRTSLRHAGAIEFMAPEQTQGHMFFESDVYSFGIILFELLSGSVPFPLKDSSEVARNEVVVAHMEAALPNLLEFREKNLPAGWSNEKKQAEMQVPAWLLTLISRCLEKKPEARFRNGSELHEFIHQHRIAPIAAPTSTVNEQDQQLLLRENSELKKQLAHFQNQLSIKDAELQQVRGMNFRTEDVHYPERRGISKTLFFSLLILTIGLASYAAYNLFSNRKTASETTTGTAMLTDSSQVDSTQFDQGIYQDTRDTSLSITFPDIIPDNQQNTNNQTDPGRDSTVSDQQDNTTTTTTEPDEPVVTNNDKPEDKNIPGRRYKIKGIAHLYDGPSESGRSSAMISSSATLVSLQEQDGYIYVEFSNSEGASTRAWLNKKDLELAK